jgi:hypothetical protein
MPNYYFLRDAFLEGKNGPSLKKNVLTVGLEYKTFPGKPGRNCCWDLN